MDYLRRWEGDVSLNIKVPSIKLSYRRVNVVHLDHVLYLLFSTSIFFALSLLLRHRKWCSNLLIWLI